MTQTHFSLRITVNRPETTAGTTLRELAVNAKSRAHRLSEHRLAARKQAHPAR